MKQRIAQLGMRKNPDSPRVHGLRLSVDSSSFKSLRQNSLLAKDGELCAVPISNLSAAEDHLLVAFASPIKLKIKSVSSRHWKL